MIHRPDHAAVFYIAQNMRDADKEEIYPLHWSQTPFDLVSRVMAFPKHVWVAGTDKPVAVFGMFEVRPKVWTAFCFATDEFPTVALEVTRWLKRHVKPMLFNELGAVRIEADSHINHKQAHRWLKLLGAIPEGIRRCYNQNGEDYVTFAMTAADFHPA